MTRIPPMPSIAPIIGTRALDLAAAAERLRLSWNSTQAKDAARSCRFYLDLIDKALAKEVSA